jgi:hypothetical protein
MNKIYRILGVAALVVTLVCNLQYSFYDANNSPNAAQAEWTYTDPYYATETVYCGSAPDRAWIPGEWIFVPPAYVSSYIASVYPYYDGYYWFRPDPTYTYQCGLNDPSDDPYFRHNYTYEITAPNPPAITY